MAFIPIYILILFVTIIIDYVAAIFIEKTTGRRKQLWLIGSIISTCSVLGIFKYFDFFTANIARVAHLAGWSIPDLDLKLILPIGLSFHTFQSLSYVIEVFRGNQKAEKHFTVYATYVMFFPQLVAGPIERPQNLLHQFYEHHSFRYDLMASGLKRMAWGFFKKLVLADRLALYVNDVYRHPRDFNGLQLTIATVFFSYQIYCDFSGYSDIAIGAAQVLGFRLMENFDNPYYAFSISEFWRRWHISLSTWFRDYVYFPLGGNRAPRPRWFLNLMVTFSLSGLWHGANWTYVIWGILNGFYLVIGVATKHFRQSVWLRLGFGPESFLRKAVMLASTFGLICVGWIVFRARNVGDAWYILSHLAARWDIHHISTEQFLLRQLPAAIAGLVILEIGQLWQRKMPISRFLAEFPRALRWSIYYGFVLAVVLFGIYRNSQFIYFQF